MTTYRLLILMCFGCVVACQSESNVKDPTFYFKDHNQARLLERIEDGDLAGVKALVESGVDINAEGAEGMRPIFWAVLMNRLDVFVELLNLGADPNVAINSPNSVGDDIGTLVDLLAASEKTDFLTAVLNHGADPNSATGSKRNQIGETVIFQAVRRDKFDNVLILLEAGADINLRNANGETPLLVAAGMKNFHLVHLLIQKGADRSLEVAQS